MRVRVRERVRVRVRLQCMAVVVTQQINLYHHMELTSRGAPVHWLVR